VFPPVPPSASRTVTEKPSILCALVCASVAVAHDRRWLSGPVSSLLPPGISPERLSRLKAAVLPAIESAVEGATTRGRPRRASDDTGAKLAAAQALLEVAAATIAGVRIRGRERQDRLVQAAERLGTEHGISRKDFAMALGIPERTLRFWANRTPAPPRPVPPPKDPPPRKPSRNLDRFNLEVTPPGLQALADTTVIEAFGVKLHLVGSQDPGNRHRRLLQSFRVVPQESSEIVIDVLSRAFNDPAGTQSIVDQGTPFIAEATKKALEGLEVDFCPQKEATPTDKAPIERAWRTIKDALSPILGLTDRLAAAIPALKDTELARSLTEILVATFLRVYLSGRSHLPHPLEGRDPLALVQVIEEAKEKARAETRSTKLLLQEIHARYAMPGSADRFVRAHRRFHLEDILEAERRLRTRACRCKTFACDRYFTGILANVSDELRRRRAAERRNQELARKLEADRRADALRNDHFAIHPDTLLHEGLNMIACQWRPAEGRLLCGGSGLGLVRVRKAVAIMVENNIGSWKDDVRRAWRAWIAEARQVPEPAIAQIQQIIKKVVDQAAVSQGPATTLLPADAARAILKSQAPNFEHPPPRDLRV
jgi:hypothetical protein